MGALQTKLRSRSGASFLLVLVFFLLCVMAGAVALTAAAANAGRISHARAQQQEYLALACAAQLLRDEMMEMSFQAEAYCTEDGRDGRLFCSPGREADERSFDAQLNTLVQSVFAQRYQDYDAAESVTAPAPLTVLVSAGELGMEPVTATVAIDGEFGLTIRLYSGDLSGAPDMTLHMTTACAVRRVYDTQRTPARYDANGSLVSPAASTGSVSTHLNLFWDHALISKGGAAA